MLGVTVAVVGWMRVTLVGGEDGQCASKCADCMDALLVAIDCGVGERAVGSGEPLFTVGFVRFVAIFSFCELDFD